MICTCLHHIEVTFSVLIAVIKNPLVLYLLVFNIFQWAGFIYVFGVLVRGWWREGDGRPWPLDFTPHLFSGPIEH